MSRQPTSGTARYKLILAYDGEAFSGSQRQARPRTVQAELEKALRILGWDAAHILMAGRTDAGVHAVGQVAAVDLRWSHRPVELRDALNANLPSDLAVRSVDVADARFHPRFDAISRRYRYQIRCDPVREPLEDRLTWRIWPPPSTPALEEVAKCFLGRHDFGAFGAAPRKGGSTIRTVTLSRWIWEDPRWSYEIVADGFLYRMVRRLVYVQVAVAQGSCSVAKVVGALENEVEHSALPAGLAPAKGLILVEVDY